MDILRIELTLRMAGMITQDLVNFLITDTQKIIGLLVEGILNIVYLIGHQKNTQQIILDTPSTSKPKKTQSVLE